MKILFVIQGVLKGGAERLVLDIAHEIQKRKGQKVLIIALDNKNEYTNLTDNVSIRMINSYVKLSISKKNKINIDEYETIVDEFKPDIIHSHTYKAELVSREKARKNITYFTHVHSSFKEFNNLDLLKGLSKQKITNYVEKLRIFKKYEIVNNHFITISKNINEVLKTQIYKTKHGNIHFLTNAINYDRFFNKKTKFLLNQVKIITVGRFEKHKNQIFLLKVIANLKKHQVPVSCYIVGDGPEKENLLLKTKELSLQNEVEFTGNVNKVENYYNNSNIYCHTALYEPFGLVLIEAMAAGLPVITLDGKGNRDLIEEGKNGYMISEQDAEKFADRIIKLWEDKQKMKEISSYAQHYAKQYDIVNYVDKLLGLYQNAIDSK